jgi:phosphomannomutase
VKEDVWMRIESDLGIVADGDADRLVESRG